MRRKFKTPRLKKSDLWTAFALLGLMALSVPSLKDDTATGRGTEVVSRVRTEGSQALHKAAIIFKISRN